MPIAPLPTELAAAARQLEDAAPADVVRWAQERFGDGLVVTSSFDDAVLVHLVATHAPGTRIVLLDTQYLFAETRWYAEHLRRRLGFDLTVVHPGPDVIPDDRWQLDVEACCRVRKVEPLERALAGAGAWMTGLRRADAASRAHAPLVAWDLARHVVKVNPLAAMSDGDVVRYERAHDLPAHPLRARGYPSVGCWPCTHPVPPGGDRRAGRWVGLTKTECGLHA